MTKKEATDLDLYVDTEPAMFKMVRQFFGSWPSIPSAITGVLAGIEGLELLFPG